MTHFVDKIHPTDNRQWEAYLLRFSLSFLSTFSATIRIFPVEKASTILDALGNHSKLIGTLGSLLKEGT